PCTLVAGSAGPTTPCWPSARPAPPRDFIRNKDYDGCMLTYAELQGNHRRFSALTGLTLAEFRLLLTAFARADERLYPPDRTAAGRPRRRSTGGGRRGALHTSEQKLLFLL